MKLRYRRLIYSTFIFVFIVLTPIIIIYTSGYRYNFKKGTIEKTGILYLETKPKDALIFIDGKYKNTTPARFPYLLPDIYSVEIMKNGYYSWQNELEIKSNLTTFAKNIILFKKTLPINIIEGEINILAISPNRQKLIYSIIKQNTEELRLLNLRGQSDLLIKLFNKKTYNNLEFISWSPSQNKLMLKEEINDFNKYLIIDIDTLKIKELFDITRLNFNQISWDATSDNYLYSLRNFVLYQIDLLNDITKPIISANIEDFKAKDKKIYYVSRTAKESFLNKIILDSPKEEKAKKIKLPFLSQYTLQISNQDYLVLLDKKNNDFFIINPNAFEHVDIAEDIILQDKAKSITWTDDFNNLLYYSDFEIWTFNLLTRQKNLISRYGKIINQALWYPHNKYIIYQLENSLNAIEGDEEELKNDIKLAELPEINLVGVDEQGNNLYFKGKAGSQMGIYRLEIQ